MKKSFFAIFVTLSIISSAQAQSDFSQWRGPNRDGIYPEKQLLKQWPNGGPELLWKFDDLGCGYASAAVTADHVYTVGTIDSVAYLFCFSLKGQELWKTRLGIDYMGEYPGTYSTPAIQKNLGYIVNSLGVLYCFDAIDGHIIWKKDFAKEYKAEVIASGFLDNLIVDDQAVYCAPGVVGNNIIALNPQTGSTQWESKGDSKVSSFCSPILINLGDQRFYIYQTEKHVVSLNTMNGQLAWKFNKQKESPPNTPFFKNGFLFVLDGQSSVKLKIENNGYGAKEVWRSQALCSFQGDAVLIGDRIYGKGSEKKFSCIDWNTGKEIFSVPNKSMVVTVISAEGLLYLYDFEGNVSLLKPLENKFEVLGTFHVEGGIKDQHCSHPVIKDGRLYLRHDNSLFVHNLSLMVSE